MNGPKLEAAREVAPSTYLLGTHLPLPMGLLPVNAFLIRGKEPVLVDCGLPVQADAFVAEVEELVDLDDLAWIYLTHTDGDHVGALDQLLERARNARLVTTFVGMAKLSLRRDVPPGRVLLLNPGQRLGAGDRELAVLTPPTFDAPETTALFDLRTRTLFSADSFGGFLPGPFSEAPAAGREALRTGISTWSTLDAPWIHHVTEDAIAGRAAPMRALEPRLVLSSHLPPAPGEMLPELIEHVAAARTAPPFVGPDQQALMQMTV